MLFVHVPSSVVFRVPALCWAQVEGGPPVVFMVIYVIHRNSSTPDIAINVIKIQFEEEKEFLVYKFIYRS